VYDNTVSNLEKNVDTQMNLTYLIIPS